MDLIFLRVVTITVDQGVMRTFVGIGAIGWRHDLIGHLLDLYSWHFCDHILASAIALVSELHHSVNDWYVLRLGLVTLSTLEILEDRLIIHLDVHLKGWLFVVDRNMHSVSTIGKSFDHPIVVLAFFVWRTFLAFLIIFVRESNGALKR